MPEQIINLFNFFIIILLSIGFFRLAFKMCIPRCIRTAIYRGNKNIYSILEKSYKANNEKIKNRKEIKDTKKKIDKIYDKNKVSFNDSNVDVDIELHDIKRSLLLDLEVLRVFYEELPQECEVTKELGTLRNIKQCIKALDIPTKVSSSQAKTSTKKLNKDKQTKNPNTKKWYGLIEFPYPSGQGLHVGHPRSYTALDIIARKRRLQAAETVGIGNH